MPVAEVRAYLDRFGLGERISEFDISSATVPLAAMAVGVEEARISEQWRGGKRSGALAHMLNEIGWKAVQLDGGYRSYRRHVLERLALLPRQFRFRVICGLTGSGKSRLLRSLADRGAQVLDLEALARHRGSLLGDLPDAPQPSQKRFDSEVLDALLHPVLLCLPVLDRDGEVSDLRVMHANPATLDPAGRGAGRLTDRSFLELYPDSVRTGLFAACLRVLTTGVLFHLPRHPWQVTTQRRTHRAVADFRITRYRAGVLLSWVGLRATPREGGEARHDR